MARRVVEELVDDLDEGPAEVTVRIGWDGEWRELDLSQRNLDTLAKVFDRYWEAGRKVNGQAAGGGGRKRGRAKASTKRQGSAADYDRQQFKTWAVENDIKLNRGRPPRQLVDRFLAATRG